MAQMCRPGLADPAMQKGSIVRCRQEEISSIILANQAEMRVEVFLSSTEAAGVADAMIEAGHTIAVSLPD